MKNILYILFLFCINTKATNYYITTTGNNANAGTLASPWATLTYAASNSSPVTAGDVVYVKAGSYGNENVVFQKSGTIGNPINFIGYTTTPGDEPTVLVNNANPYAAYTTSVMPTYTGTSRTSGLICFNAEDAQYLIIKNFQISAYGYGVFLGGSIQKGNNKLYNVNVMTIGDPANSYNGSAILLGSMGEKFSDHNILTNCLVVNSCAEGIDINGDNNTLIGCKVYCNENTSFASTDYFILVCGSFNLIKNCYINRTPGQSGSGHGISIKSNAEQTIDGGLPLPTISPRYNKILYCQTVNMGEGYCFRHRPVQYNIISSCRSSGNNGGSTETEGEGNGVTIRDGASWNICEKLWVDSCDSGIKFVDTGEDGGATSHPGNYNKIYDCVFSNCFLPVYFADGGVSTDAGDNLISNCSFYLGKYFFDCASRCTTMRYEACIFYGNSASGTGGYWRGDTYSTDIVAGQFKYCCFYNINGGLPGGWSSTGQVTIDPKYTNVSTRDFHLQPTSPCINAVTSVIAETGITTSLNKFANPEINDLIWIGNNKRYLRTLPDNITRDYDNKVRTGTPEIGAFEYP